MGIQPSFMKIGRLAIKERGLGNGLGFTDPHTHVLAYGISKTYIYICTYIYIYVYIGKYERYTGNGIAMIE